MLERKFEQLLFTTRWLLAPVYFGLSIALIALVIKFYQELYHVFPHLLAMSEADIVLTVLTLIDIALISSLLIMVMLSGYENFVSKLDVDETAEKLAWMGKLDAGTLKIKVAASIVAISSIHLLQVFMNLKDIANDKLFWYVVFHMTFVFSALLIGFLDKIAFAMHREH